MIAQYLYIEVAIASTLLAAGLIWLLRKKLQTIDALKFKLREQLLNHKKTIQNLENKKPESPPPPSPIKEKEEKPDSSAQNLLGEIEKLKLLYKKSKEKIDHLKQSNREKRRLIAAIEARLKAFEISDEELHKTIEALTTQLKDSEMCTATLELETDDLRTQLDVVGDLIPENLPTGVIANDFTTAADLLFECKKEEEVVEAFKCLERPEDSRLILYVKANDNLYIEMGKDANSEAKEFITSTDPSHYGQWIKSVPGELYRLEHCGILKTSMVNKDKTYIRKLERFCFIADQIIQRLKLKRTNKAQQDFLRKIISEAKSATASSNEYINELFSKSSDILHEYKEESQALLKSIDLTDKQEQQISEMHADYTDEILALFSSREVYDQGYGNLLKILSKS